MITVRLKGGMGNQMFQYAFARAIAERHDDQFRFDLTFLLDRAPRKNFVFRNYDIDIFNITERFTLLSRASRRFPIPSAYLFLDEAGVRMRAKLNSQQYIKETVDFNIDEVSRQGDIFLDGYWQNEKYFASIVSTIRQEFILREPLSERARQLEAEIRAGKSIGVNVRRGDFVTVQRSMERHGFVGAEYYERGIKAILERLDGRGVNQDIHVYVFSDEIDWCRENLKFPGMSVTYVGHEYAGKKFGEYLYLLSACRHFIIPNSSFAWWAAWLASNPEKIIVAPKRWYADSDDDRGVVPPKWIRV